MQRTTTQLDAHRNCAVLLKWQMFWCAALLTLVGFTPLSLRADETRFHQASGPLTLVELYTSQGCSSCPPADAFLGDLADRSDVLALSFHVDYWNTDEWQDPFSHEAFSLRQRAYKESLKTDYVYTPQMVVGGAYAGPGGQRQTIIDAIDQTSSLQSDQPTLSIRRLANDRVEIKTPALSYGRQGTLYAAVYDSQNYTRVRGGENRGRTLSNVNVVKRLIAVSPYVGQPQTFTLALSDLDAMRSDGVAIFIQVEKAGRVLSAAAVPPRPSSAAQQVKLSLAEQPTLR